ncbi:MAG: ABC-F type ribosomal protection protein [Defluviitaleaceae bacterium]|nr:ABC-F type ribosomal protection protein [Defluviitaleaceae bacterium]
MDLLIKANNINIEYAGRDILGIDGLEIYARDRIGMVGANGAGKSTLLRVLAGEVQPAGCKIQRLGDAVYISQVDGVDVNAVADFEALSRMGLAGIDAATMSGGEETRAKIAHALSAQVHAIFADEPTSHLDRGGIGLLAGQLKAFDGALIIVSHDRYFLDQVVDKIWELKDSKITEYWGNYSQYRQQKDEETQRQQDLYEQAQLERGRLEQSVEEVRRQAKKKDKQKGVKSKAQKEGSQWGNQKSPGSKQQRMHKTVQNLERRAESLAEIAPPERVRSVNFRQSKALELHNKFPVVGKDINLSFGERVIFDRADFTVPLGAKVAFTGANGTGKTTLLKMIKNRHPALTISPKAEFGYFEQTGYKFTTDQSAMAFMEENSDYQSEIRAVLAAVGFSAQDIKKSLQVLSGGEIIKLLLSKMLLGRYNILLLDEPGNYLDIGSLEALESMLKAYVGTIIFVSHDKRFVDNVADLVYEFTNGKILKVK